MYIVHVPMIHNVHRNVQYTWKSKAPDCMYKCEEVDKHVYTVPHDVQYSTSCAVLICSTYIFEQIEWNLKTHMKLNKIPALSSFRHV